MLLLLRSQLGVLVFEVEDHADAGQVQPVTEQLADAAQPVEIVFAVPAGAAVGAGRFEQPAGFVQPQVLHASADQFGRHGYAVHATVRVGSGGRHSS